MSQDSSQPPLDPRVVRRTLTIAGTFFGLGLLLACLWVYKEVRRVRTMERLDLPPAGASSTRTPAPATPTNSPP